MRSIKPRRRRTASRLTAGSANKTLMQPKSAVVAPDFTHVLDWLLAGVDRRGCTSGGKSAL